MDVGPLQFRRLAGGDRLSVVLAGGEPLFDEATGLLYIGDAVTAGGLKVTRSDAEILALINAQAGGSGSGLDADLLDGLEASAFSLSGHLHSGVYVETGDVIASSAGADDSGKLVALDAAGLIDSSFLPGGGTGGEINSGANVGGGAEIYRDKTGTQLNLRSLANTTSIEFTQGADSITGVVLPAGVDHNSLGGYLAAEHAPLDDGATDSGSVWSAAKLNTDLAGKLNSSAQINAPSGPVVVQGTLSAGAVTVSMDMQFAADAAALQDTDVLLVQQGPAGTAPTKVSRSDFLDGIAGGVDFAGTAALAAGEERPGDLFLLSSVLNSDEPRTGRRDELIPAQVSAGEIAGGTDTNLRLWSAKDVFDSVAAHAGSASLQGNFADDVYLNGRTLYALSDEVNPVLGWDGSQVLLAGEAVIPASVTGSAFGDIIYNDGTTHTNLPLYSWSTDADDGYVLIGRRDGATDPDTLEWGRLLGSEVGNDSGVAGANLSAALLTLASGKVGTNRVVGTAADSGLFGGGALGSNLDLELDYSRLTVGGSAVADTDLVAIRRADGSQVSQTRAQFLDGIVGAGQNNTGQNLGDEAGLYIGQNGMVGSILDFRTLRAIGAGMSFTENGDNVDLAAIDGEFVALDGAPKLGGPLDLDGNQIVTPAGVDVSLAAGVGGDIVLTTLGAGRIQLNAANGVNINGQPLVVADLDDMVPGSILVYSSDSGGGLVDIPVGANDQVLIADSAVSGTGLRWGDQSGGGATESNDLTDFTVTSPADGQAFRRRGGVWVNEDAADATFTTPLEGEYARFAADGGPLVNSALLVSDDPAPTFTVDLTLDGANLIDANDAELIEFETEAAALNHIVVGNGAAGNVPYIRADGTETEVPLELRAKNGSVDGTETDIVARLRRHTAGVTFWDMETRNLTAATQVRLRAETNDPASAPNVSAVIASRGTGNLIIGKHDGGAGISTQVTVNVDAVQSPRTVTVPDSDASIPGRGTVFPTSPVDGQQFYRTDLRTMFYADLAANSSAGRWLSVERYEWGFGSNPSTNDGAQLKPWGGAIPGTSSTGFFQQFDLWAIDAVASFGTAAGENYDLELREIGGNSLVAAVTIANGNTTGSATLDVAVPADLVHYCEVNSAGSATPSISLVTYSFRRDGGAI